MVIPAVLGEQAGKASAEADAKEYAKGCEKSKPPCIELKRGGEHMGKGFVLDDSPNEIAIFDTDLKRGRTLPRDGLEMVVGRIPSGMTP